MRPSALLKVEDEAAALDFDLACTTRLLFYDAEQKAKELEAFTGKNDGPVVGAKEYVTTVTPQTDIGDQGF